MIDLVLKRVTYRSVLKVEAKEQSLPKILFTQIEISDILPQKLLNQPKTNAGQTYFDFSKKLQENIKNKIKSRKHNLHRSGSESSISSLRDTFISIKV